MEKMTREEKDHLERLRVAQFLLLLLLHLDFGQHFHWGYGLGISLCQRVPTLEVEVLIQNLLIRRAMFRIMVWYRSAGWKLGGWMC